MQEPDPGVQEHMSIMTIEPVMAVEVDAVHAMGTPSQRCMNLLRRLPSSLDHRGRSLQVTVHASPDAEYWASQAEPTGLVVVLVDAPARALLAAGPDGSSTDPMSALARWCDFAARALQFAHRRPEHCVLVDISARSDGVQEMLRELGLSAPDAIDDSDHPVKDDPDPIDIILAERLASLDPGCSALYEELRISCRWPTAMPAPATEASDTVNALLAHRALVARCQDLQKQAAQLDSLRQEQDLLLRQVRELEELTRALHSKATAAERSEVSLGKKVAGMEARTASLQTQVTEMTERLRAAQAASTAQLESMRIEREGALDDVRRLKSEAVDLVRTHRLASRGPGLQIRADGLELRSRVDDGDHRHLDFTLEALAVGARRIVDLRFRLVEHRGRPGLVLFAQHDGLPSLGQWEPHGEEGGASFMTLLPSEERGESLLRRMATSDWQVIRGLVNAVWLELSRDEAGSLTRWRAVAGRLNCQLDALPPRLRYDAMSVRPASAQALDVSLLNALFGDKSLGDMNLRWWPSRSGEQAGLTALAPADGAEPPLASWPSQPDGLLRPEYALPVGSCWSPAAWLALPERDKAILLSVLDGLSGVAGHMSPDAPLTEWTIDATAEAARQLNRATRRSERVLQLRRTVSRLWRRHLARAC